MVTKWGWLWTNWPDRLNPDWCRLRTGWLGCLAGEVLAEEAGVMALGVTDTSQTGPSYSPLGTPLSSASCNLRKQTQQSKYWQWKQTRKYSIPEKRCRHVLAQSVTSYIVPPAFHKTIINHYKNQWWWGATFMFACLTRQGLKSGIIPCCELLSSCRRSQGKVFGPHSVPTPRWRGGSPPPRRSCPGWSPPAARRAPLCLQRCCTPQSVEENSGIKVNEKEG